MAQRPGWSAPRHGRHRARRLPAHVHHRRHPLRLPPHIAQVIGHTKINTAMGYNAVYPTETIEAHRAFITRRRTLRPAEEYRTPTETEWGDFLGHFERRKPSVGTCARAYGTA